MRRCAWFICGDPLPEDAALNRQYCSRICQGRARYHRNREDLKRKARERYAADPEPVKARARRYYEENAPVVRARNKARRRMLRRIALAGARRR